MLKFKKNQERDLGVTGGLWGARRRQEREKGATMVSKGAPVLKKKKKKKEKKDIGSHARSILDDFWVEG